MWLGCPRLSRHSRGRPSHILWHADLLKPHESDGRLIENADGGRDLGSRPPSGGPGLEESGRVLTSARCGQVGQLLGRQVLERPSLTFEAGSEPQRDLLQFGKVDPPGDLGQLGWGHVGESLPEAIELGLEPEHGLQQLGMGLRRSPEDHAVVSGAEAMMVILAVESESEDRGSNPAGSAAAGLRRHGHLEEGLSQVDYRYWVVASGQDPSALRRPPRHANLIGFPTAIEQRPECDSAGPPRRRPATFLRPAQAFLGDAPRHPVGRPDGDRPRLDLIFAE